MKSPYWPCGIVLLACATALASSLSTAFPAAVEQQGTGAAQPPAGGGGPQPAAQGGRGRGGGVFPQTEPDDAAGFVPIFDGKTLSGWDGDSRYWRVENGEIVGETTPEKVVTQNNFLI